MPFFLFDLDKATKLDEGEKAATDFLKDTFFTSFDKKRKGQEKGVGAAAMERNGAVQKLRGLLDKSDKEVMTYMKGLSPSGVELEILSLATFEFTEGGHAVSCSCSEICRLTNSSRCSSDQLKRPRTATTARPCSTAASSATATPLSKTRHWSVKCAQSEKRVRVRSLPWRTWSVTMFAWWPPSLECKWRSEKP